MKALKRISVCVRPASVAEAMPEEIPNLLRLVTAEESQMLAECKSIMEIIEKKCKSRWFHKKRIPCLVAMKTIIRTQSASKKTLPFFHVVPKGFSTRLNRIAKEASATLDIKKQEFRRALEEFKKKYPEAHQLMMVMMAGVRNQFTPPLHVVDVNMCCIVIFNAESQNSVESQVRSPNFKREPFIDFLLTLDDTSETQGSVAEIPAEDVVVQNAVTESETNARPSVSRITQEQIMRLINSTEDPEAKIKQLIEYFYQEGNPPEDESAVINDLLTQHTELARKLILDQNCPDRIKERLKAEEKFPWNTCPDLAKTTEDTVQSILDFCKEDFNGVFEEDPLYRGLLKNPKLALHVLRDSACPDRVRKMIRTVYIKEFKGIVGAYLFEAAGASPAPLDLSGVTLKEHSPSVSPEPKAEESRPEKETPEPSESSSVAPRSAAKRERKEGDLSWLNHVHPELIAGITRDFLGDIDAGHGELMCFFNWINIIPQARRGAGEDVLRSPAKMTSLPASPPCSPALDEEGDARIQTLRTVRDLPNWRAKPVGVAEEAKDLQKQGSSLAFSASPVMPRTSVPRTPIRASVSSPDSDHLPSSASLSVRSPIVGSFRRDEQFNDEMSKIIRGLSKVEDSSGITSALAVQLTELRNSMGEDDLSVTSINPEKRVPVDIAGLHKKQRTTIDRLQKIMPGSIANGFLAVIRPRAVVLQRKINEYYAQICKREQDAEFKSIRQELLRLLESVENMCVLYVKISFFSDHAWTLKPEMQVRLEAIRMMRMLEYLEIPESAAEAK